MNRTKEALKFYSAFEEVRGMSSIAYISYPSDEKRAMRQIKASEASIKKDGIAFFLSSSTLSFLKQIAPKKDKGYLLLGLAFAKYRQEERDADIYFPIMSTSVEVDWERGFREGGLEILVPWEAEIFYDRSIIGFFFDGLKSKFGEEEFIDHLPKTFSEFFPLHYRGSFQELFGFWKGFFEKNISDSLDIQFPSITADNSVVAMFFVAKTEPDFNLSREFEEALKEEDPLLEEYLTYLQKENREPEAPKIPFHGALTKSYPLGRGQAKVLAINEMDEQIIAVMGSPGTGKSTLFLSVIANEITKRAVFIATGKGDYNNLMLLTSTSNKAVENVYESLLKASKHGGLIYVGGNNENKVRSNKEVEKFLLYFERQEFDPELHKKLKKGIENIVRYFERAKEKHEELKNFIPLLQKIAPKGKDDIKKAIQSLEQEVDMDRVFEAKKLQENIETVSKIVGEPLDMENFLEYFDNALYMEMRLVKEKLSKEGFLKRIFSKEEVYEKLPFTPSSKEEFHFVFETLETVRKMSAEERERAKNVLDKFETLSELKKLERVIEGVPDSLIKRARYGEDFLEFFRKVFYKLNYKLNIMAQRFLFQEALSKKEQVIQAVEFFFAQNKYEYIRDNFGFSEKETERFLSLLSLVYPVISSALASVPYIFPRYLKKPFRTVLADEAAMITVHGIIPALRRSQRAIVVGDPKQLTPVLEIADPFIDTLRKECSEDFWRQYSPTQTNAFSRAAGAPDGSFEHHGRGIVLEEHRRCAPEIASLFIKVGKYGGIEIKSAVPKSQRFQKIGKSLIFWNVKPDMKRGYKRENMAEIKGVSVLVNKFIENGYRPDEIGVITPYRDQEKALKKYLPHVKVGTVHKFQGSEFPVIIFSPVVSGDENSSFVNNRNMVNVAISRAKEIFAIVGDYEKLSKERGPLKEAAEFIVKRGLAIGV